MRSIAFLQAGAPDAGIGDAAGGEIDPNAADAGLVKSIEVAIGRLVVDHGNTACVVAARLHAEQGRGIIGAVNAWRHDHHALDFQGLVQRRHLFGDAGSGV